MTDATSGPTPQSPASGTSASEAPTPRSRLSTWLDTRFRSAAAIYGLIVFAAFVTISSDHADDAWEMLNTAVWTLLVFFIAHVFAHTLTDHGERGLRASIAHSAAHAVGMLWAALPATIALVACGINGLSAEDAYEATMWVTWVVLAILGYVAYWRRGAHIVIRLLGAAGTAALGIAIVLLEYAVH